ncbi:hypothetical protein ACFC1R_37545 [Kitasatospora sp. NPDC056138]|uniref:hypothetical protein n=1 Tax=Kitasatospora sp. NPDC056138 TaxID=3345724 RepID=UPI0035E1D203
MRLTDPSGLFAALHRLHLPACDYVVCGSAVLYARGLRARIGDLDVLARGQAWRIALTLARPIRPPSGHGWAVYHPSAAIEIVDRWTPGWPTDQLIEGADVIDGIRFMRLGDVLRWKEAARRPKDGPDIAAIHRLHALWTGTPSPAPHAI